MNNDLLLASIWGEINKVKYFISQGANIDVKIRRGETPLHFASYKGYINIVEYLISKGANIECKTQKGEIPLYLASGMNHINIVQYLISQGDSYANQLSCNLKYNLLFKKRNSILI